MLSFAKQAKPHMSIHIFKWILEKFKGKINDYPKKQN